jgi:hypothetical protein
MIKSEIKSIRLDGVEYPVHGSIELRSGDVSGAIPMHGGTARIQIRYAVTPVRAFVLRAALAGDERFTPLGLETQSTFADSRAALGLPPCAECPAVGACVHEGDHVMCIVCGTWWTWARDEGRAVVAETRTPAEVALAARAPVDPETLFAAMRRFEQEMI